MKTSVDTYVGPAFRAWRSWRVMPFQRLGEPASVRLCASGTRGLPKVWEPRQAMHAVCGKFETTHDAPWPDCECGFHGYRHRDDADDHLASFADLNHGEEVGWAFGEVSLWGRIVEHEDGYRGEWAYPYAITVFGDAAVAKQVRGLYGIDVDVLPVEQLPSHGPDVEEDDEEPPPRSGGVIGQLADIDEKLAALQRLVDGESCSVPRAATKYDLLRDNSNLDRVLNTAWEPMSSREIAAAMMKRDGPVDADVSPSDLSALGQNLYALAMRRKARRLTGPKGETWWLCPHCAVPADCQETDPTLEHLDRDVQMAVALYQVAGREEATAKAIVAALSELTGEPQASNRWSGTFVRLQLRGWATSELPRTYALTDYGFAVAKRGEEIPEWRGCLDDHLTLSELAAAALEAGDFVDFYEVARRFRNGGAWDPNGHPDGCSVAQRLLSLQRAGLVETSRRPDSTRLLYRPTAQAVRELSSRV